MRNKVKQIITRFIQDGIEVIHLSINDLPKNGESSKRWCVYVPNGEVFKNLYDKLISLGWRFQIERDCGYIQWLILNSQIRESGFVGWEYDYDPIKYTCKPWYINSYGYVRSGVILTELDNYYSLYSADLGARQLQKIIMNIKN